MCTCYRGFAVELRFFSKNCKADLLTCPRSLEACSCVCACWSQDQRFRDLLLIWFPEMQARWCVCVCWATGCIFDGWFSHEFSLIPYFLPNRMNICGFVIFIQQSHIGHSHSLSSEGLGAFQEFMEQNPIDTNSPYYDAMPTLICREFASFCFMCLGCFGALSRFFVWVV